MDLSIAHGQMHYFLWQAMLTFKTYCNCVLSTVNLISQQFDFVGGIFSATNRENMQPRFLRDSPATIRQPTVHVSCTRSDCVLPGCINLKLQTMNNETRKTKMHGSGPKSRWGYNRYFKKSSEGIMHSSNLYDDMQVFLLRRDSRLLLLLLLVEKQLCWYTCPLYTCSASENSDSKTNL